VAKARSEDGDKVMEKDANGGLAFVASHLSGLWSAQEP